MNLERQPDEAARARLGLFDAVSIIVGIVIGSTIYQSPPIIFGNVPDARTGLMVWGLAGILSLFGALCYAELASTYPRSGGDYVYLSRAFGPWVGFLFGWAQMTVILTGSIGAMAFVFADYAKRLWDMSTVLGAEPVVPPNILYAVLAVAVLSVVNILGVVLGKWTQNLLTLAKVIGLGGILYAGFAFGKASGVTGVKLPVEGPGFGLAMILVLYAYGGWNDAAFVAAEVRNRRHMALALVLGTALITMIYLAVNAAYLMALGFEGVRSSKGVAADVLRLTPLGDVGDKAMSTLVMISALGALNGLIFTGSRVYSALGTHHRIFARLGYWSPRLGSPLWALLVQGIITTAMIVGLGTQAGRDAIDRFFTMIVLDPPDWKKYGGGFDTLVAATAPTFWAFFLLSGLSLFALRQRDRNITRPFAVPLFPVVPLLFCGTCFYMLLAAIDWAGKLSLLAASPLVIGLLLYLAFGERETAVSSAVE